MRHYELEIIEKGEQVRVYVVTCYERDLTPLVNMIKADKQTVRVIVSEMKLFNEKDEKDK